jgi:hypothetical protein
MDNRKIADLTVAEFEALMVRILEQNTPSAIANRQEYARINAGKYGDHYSSPFPWPIHGFNKG